MTVYLACAVFGGLLLVLQLVGGFAGADGDADAADHAGGPGAHGHAPAVVQLSSLRVVAAALAGFGLAGAGLLAAGSGRLVAALAAVLAAIAAGAGVTALTRLLLRLESDGSLRLERAVGHAATVYVPIPAAGRGAGKVQLALQGRLVEAAAVSAGPTALATGEPVVVVDVAAGETLVVAPDPAAAR